MEKNNDELTKDMIVIQSYQISDSKYRRVMSSRAYIQI